METTRVIAVTRLGELNKISPIRHSVMDLHRKKPMLQRVHRKAQKRYHENVELQKKKLTGDIKKIDTYLQSVKDYKDYLSSKAIYDEQLAIYESQIVQPFNELDPVRSVSLFAPIAPIAPTVLQKPIVLVNKNPQLARTKLHRYKRRFR